jgi:hypothetical protein
MCHIRDSFRQGVTATRKGPARSLKVLRTGRSGAMRLPGFFAASPG